MRRLTGEGVPCTLDMVGGYEEDYGAVVEEAESEGWLKYRGYQEDVRPFIAAAHCFVLPSWHEGMANTNLERASGPAGDPPAAFTAAWKRWRTA